MARARRALAWLEGHWTGDLIGCACLFTTLILLTIFAGVLQ